MQLTKPILIPALAALLCLAAPAEARKKKAAPAPKQPTSSQVKKQEASVQKEIRLTQQQITQNETAITDGMARLSALETEIGAQTKRVNTLQGQHSRLTSDIAAIEANISAGEKNLSTLRSHYVAAIKKMRVARKRTNPLAFIFSSKSFYQAWRRLRYFTKFNEWRSRREAQINTQIEELNRNKSQLATAQKQLQANLNDQQAAKRLLDQKHAEQDKTVKSLRAHGDALRAHLAQKQAEANRLAAQVASLIAAEQEAARQAEIKRQQEEQKRAEAARAAELKRQQEAEAARLAEEKRAAEEAARAAEQQKAKPEKKKKEKKKKEEKKKEEKKKEDKKKNEEKKKSTDDKSYADARQRKPRSDSSSEASTGAKSTGKSNAGSSAASSSFAAAKGSLPRPVSGSFSIYSKFGTHGLPGMPDVKYDNPGIDATVSSGASAQAVFPGTVTGIYVLPGYSTVVIVNHGEYYTVYGNIGNPTVKKGDKVQTGQALGRLVADEEEGGRTTIHFEVWKGREKLNPESWIR